MNEICGRSFKNSSRKLFLLNAGVDDFIFERREDEPYSQDEQA